MQNKKEKMNDPSAFQTQIERDLVSDGWCLCMTEGDSMEPLLREQKNAVLIERVNGLLNINDVALYRRPWEKKMVLHRVVKVRKNDYLICGDNRLYREPVPHDWVVGVMQGYYEGEEFIPVTSEKYLTYVQKMRRHYWIRYVRAVPSRIKRKIHRMVSNDAGHK